MSIKWRHEGERVTWTFGATVRHKSSAHRGDQTWISSRKAWRGHVEVGVGYVREYFDTAEEAKTWCEAVMRLEGLL